MSQEKLLMIPGPTPVHPRIIHSLSLPTVSHVSPVMVEETKHALANLKKIVFCDNGEAFIVAGAGTLSMEMALVNTVAAGEKILVLSQGYFGQRMSQIAESFGIGCDIVQSPWGSVVDPEELESRLTGGSYAAVSCTHVDTATGACAPVKAYADILKRFPETLFFVDGVCATGGIEERMTSWSVDVVLTAAQKCFGVPPGLAIAVFSDRAMHKRRSMGRIPAYYADVLRWLPIMKDPSKYFSTPCVNQIRAFYEGTRIMLEEGMAERFKRHATIGAAVRAAADALSLSLFTDSENLADTLSVVRYPQGIEDRAFRTTLADKGVIVAGGLGETAGKVFRMGHMGNLSFSQLEFAVSALESTLASLGYSFSSGAGSAAARAVIQG